MTPSIFFNLPSGKICRITKAELLARDRERDAELEKKRKEMEKTRQEMAELKAMLSASKISSPMVSDKASCDVSGVKEAKAGVAKYLEPALVDDEMDLIPPENKVK